jgi:hypothetical protein
MPFGGWSRDKADAFKEQFYRFLGHARIVSKDLGPCIIGDSLYVAQHRFFDVVFDGLAEDIHDFKHLKSRQLGISTGSRLLLIFWAGVHPGLRGYMVFDTSAHMEEARLELIQMIRDLPRELKFPEIVRENRYLIELANGTRINFAAAGTKESKASGTLGRSSGVNFVLCSELCSWAGGENITAFKNSLSEIFPDRLYIWESTGRGYNLWNEMWEKAKADERQIAHFTGWWGKDTQRIDRDEPDFIRYGHQPPTEREAAQISEVAELYGWRITPEQLAWIRRNSDPNAKPEGEAGAEYEADSGQLAEQAWVERDSFQLPGSVFFQPEKLQMQANRFSSTKYTGVYSFHPGTEFLDMQVFKATNAKSVELKVWEEPVEDSVYIVAADPAFGHNERNDRSAIQVTRAFADGLDQVAEYAWPLITTDQFAWVIMAIAAWYAGDRSEVYVIVELNGPGDAVWSEIRRLQRQISMPYFAGRAAERGLSDIFRNVRHFIYTRSDSMGGGRAWQFKTTPDLKEKVMEELRSATEAIKIDADGTLRSVLRIRSMETLKEMRTVARVDSSIEAQGTAKDDRVMTMAMNTHCWVTRVRTRLMGGKRTREFEAAKSRMTVADRAAMFNRYQMDAFFAMKGRERAQKRIAAMGGWRARR